MNTQYERISIPFIRNFDIRSITNPQIMLFVRDGVVVEGDPSKCEKPKVKVNWKLEGF